MTLGFKHCVTNQVLLTFILLCSLSVKVWAESATTPAAERTFIVKSADGNTHTITSENLSLMDKHSVTATSHGETHTYTTVSLFSLLQNLAVIPTEKLKRDDMTTLIELVSGDNYRVIFSLAELDPAIGNRAVYIAFAAEGKPLPQAMGPWRLVVPEDGRHARWIWNITEINIRKF